MLIRLTLTVTLLLTGCVGGGGMLGMAGGRSANAKPPYVEDDPKPKAKKPCPAQSTGTQDTATQNCGDANPK